MPYLCTGRPTKDDLEKIRTRKPEEPKLEVTLKDGSKRTVWCTFGPQQIDIDVSSPSGQHPEILLRMCITQEFLTCWMHTQPVPSNCLSPAC